MDDGPEGQSASTGFDRAAERNRAVPHQLPEWFITGLALDDPSNPLRQQEPPGDDVALPGVDDDLHVLVEQITFANSQCHCRKQVTSQ
jgi:hypothetical protein